MRGGLFIKKKKKKKKKNSKYSSKIVQELEGHYGNRWIRLFGQIVSLDFQIPTHPISDTEYNKQNREIHHTADTATKQQAGCKQYSS
jgi:hypothetical protein